LPFDGAFSPIHILIVAVVALLVLGPEQLPKAAHQVGRGMREFRRVQQHLGTELRDIVAEFDMSPTGDQGAPKFSPSTASGEAEVPPSKHRSRGRRHLTR
jgi:TatA/E family protein of Tat protein translocase